MKVPTAQTEHLSTQSRDNRLSRAIPWSLAVALGMIAFLAPHAEWHQDLGVFRTASEGLRHPYWARWLFSLLTVVPEPVAFLGLSLACTALLYLAVRVFGGEHWMVFTSFAFAWTLYYGQIDGLVVGGLAFAWWALRRRLSVLIGAGLILASIKPQLSAPLALAIWWWSPSRLKALIVPAVIAGISFLQWGWWVPDWLQRLGGTYDLVGLSRNISLWPLVGPWIWLIWPAIFWLPLPRPRKLMAIAAGTALTAPYFPLPSAILFLSMPIPWWFWAASQLPMLSGILGEWLYYLMKAVPLSLLIWAAWPAVQARISSLRGYHNA
jgi:hypothetical protein